MSSYAVLRSVTLGAQHQPTGRTRHTRNGEELPAPTRLLVAKYPADQGFYLFYLDAVGEELTDTYHETLESALEQAKWEFNVEATEWVVHEDSSRLP